MKAFYTLIFVLMAGTAYGQSNLPACPALDNSQVGIYRTKNWNNCFGIYAQGDGFVYVGAYQNGVPNGQGSSTYANGDKHVGNYKDGALHGQGAYTWASGEKYVGEWKGEKRNGEGINTLANGEKFVGEWKDDKKNGQGISYSTNGSIKQSGIYKDDKLITSQYIDPNSFRRIATENSDSAYGQGNFAEKTESDNPIIKKILTGEVRFDCGLLCTFSRANNKVNLSLLHLTKQWSLLAIKTYEIGFKDDLSYFYLARAVEGLGHFNAAEIYYKLALEERVKCKDTNSCSGIKIFEEVYASLNSFNSFKKDDTFKASNKDQLNIHQKTPTFFIEAFASEVNTKGMTTISIKVNLETSSLTIDGEELGGKKDGSYITERFILAGQETKFEITAKDHIGNKATKTITVIRQEFVTQNEAIGKTERQIAIDTESLAKEIRRLEEEKSQREQAKLNQSFSLQVNNSQPNADGDVTINIQTNADTASLKINGEEQGGRADGKYTVKRVARAGQETRLEIYAKDVYGNTDTKSITVSRSVVESKVTYPQLNPDRIKRQPERDAVAVIIGISNYKSLPKAEFAKDDAQVFYDYAIRALGVKPGNIKLLMDEQADAEEIYTAFKTWLPARVKSTTDVYVFYSGHGLPTQDGSGLYWLPQRANRDLISKTGILLSEVNSDIQASKPKSVTIFMDACYSGQARGGETLVASARPIALKSQPTTFPSNFTVISASQADQISSSSPELQHGIFSYYLMRGMEGEADLNRDAKITLDEIQSYLSENVGRQARIMNRQQEPQVIGDGSRVLVGR